MVHFLGILEKKGLDAIQEYARLIAEVSHSHLPVPATRTHVCPPSSYLVHFFPLPLREPKSALLVAGARCKA